MCRLAGRKFALFLSFFFNAQLQKDKKIKWKDTNGKRETFINTLKGMQNNDTFVARNCKLYGTVSHAYM